MISLIMLIPGVVIPAVVGWLIIDLLEWDTSVIGRYEKWVMGFVFGMTFSMFCVFAGNVWLGIPLTLVGFAMIFAGLLVVLGAAWGIRRGRFMTSVKAGAPPGRPYIADVMHSTPRPMMIALAVMGGWVLIRLLAMAGDTAVTPTFFDDAMDNWNLRGKLFFLQEKFSLAFPWDPSPGVSSYPPTVPLSKTWLSTLAGGWHEGLVNMIHVVWFACLLALVYWTLRRMLSWEWSALGTIILASLPLELIHGMSPYADVFLSLHIFVGVSLLFHALKDRGHESQGVSRNAPTYLRLSAFAIALIPFTKNEGWALYFPVLAFLYAATLGWLVYRKTMTVRQVMMTAGFALLLAVIIAGPWIAFKFANGLAFGNAKGLDLNFRWQPGVFASVIVNTFLEGNWGLLMPLFFGLLIARWRSAFRSPLLLLSAFILIPYLGQLFLYHFTGLSTEAILQTGYARGLIHLMPVIVVLTVLLLHDVILGRVESGQRKVESGQ
ncbi:MAG: hypothetical protein HOO67_00210 [Candidatus Peribacteraceae bacterium]|nr:hypothetical protein [Candidatus Peribacteraceae bacterium]